MDNRETEIRKNPADDANFLSLLVFGWTASIFRKGRDMNVTDLYGPLESDESKRLGDCLEREWKKELMKADRELELGKDGAKTTRRKPSLGSAIVRMFWIPYMLQGVLLLILSTALRITQPILQSWILNYFDSRKDLTTRYQVLLYAGLLILVNLVIIFIIHHTNMQIKRIGMRVRVACCSLIYRKVLRLDQAAVNNAAAGKVANLISNDVARFDEVFLFLHFIWIMPIQVAIIGYVMWQAVGVATLVGIGAMMMLMIPFQGYLSKISAKLRYRIGFKTDERVQLMSELISGIQVVKMYSWEKPFETIVSKVRALEMRLIGFTSYLRGYHIGMILLSDRVSIYLTLVTFVLMGNQLTAQTTFLVVGLFAALMLTCGFNFPHALTMGGETAMSLKRLTQYLLLKEVKFPVNGRPSDSNGLQDTKKPLKSQEVGRKLGFAMNNVAANWIHGQLPPTLYEVSLEVKNQSLCAVVGPVASGKSSLLHLLLGELTVGAGRLSFFTEQKSVTTITSRDIRISYASQDPWLFSASIRDNILFGQPYDESRYQEVTSVCALHKDFEQLPHGDLTFVGERGASLSGGQRARVNLARAVYRDAELYLLDDPLSAVDAEVGRHLFEECITGFLKDKTRILVTHQLQYLPQADTVVVLKRGTVECQGTYEELFKSNFHILESKESEEPDEVEGRGDGHEENLQCKTTAVTEDDNDNQSEVTKSSQQSEDTNAEEISTGIIPFKVYWGYFMASGNPCLLALWLAVFTAGQIALSGSEYWLTHWTNQENLRTALQMNESSATHFTSYRNDTINDLPQMSFAKSLWFDDYGLMYPTHAVYVYTILLFGAVLLFMIRSMLFMRICVNASCNIHASMFTNILRATMRFFNTNPSGRILNRFSKDVGAMDELLPRTMLDTLQILFVTVAILTVMSIVNYWMIIPVVLMGGISYFITTWYLMTVQNIRRLEGILKSPVFSHVNSTLNGLLTIRSTGTLVEELLRKEFDRHQDAHSGAWFLIIAIETAFGFILDLVSSSLVVCICFSFILADDGKTSPGFVGLAISQSLMITGMLPYGVRLCASVISHMTSVERVLQYTNLPKEGPFTTENPPPPSWPSKGGLVIKDVSMRYADNKPPILKGLNLEINPGWKVGIVGRTGAGKSSLISALFRLTGDGLEGEIVLDGIDTKSIGLHELRPRISIIPQEPVLFSESLRHNLDPFDQYSDADLWASLQEVELGDAVTSLDFRVAAGGANFSVGQRQLICLARAILRNNQLLVLDEATANVDRRTDALIQTTIRRRFADCTVLTIAHRLNTIMDSDRVLVMAGGRAVEFDHPHLLLKNREGHFSQMLQQSGKTMAAKLAAIAENAFSLCPEYDEDPNDGTVIVAENSVITRL